ncbi:PREDICTED: caffeoylshikimate esterase-like [Populus euphratica]|uniref:Caffeoylshikimate esterase-like n=1 Tax=Populus euphratica TaxID=75702 RepID=A0AAJ6XJ61_POPEU|nr:PREDICTED: caffeoylshikimate esterase-like [Populus euphratica]XP_011020703.1 PREDICTED: caffeoylshikimate esterase-like [Populus euphratica]
MARETGNVRYDEEYVLNSRGMKLFTCKWIPMNQEPKALIFICHGYAMECSVTMNSTAVRLAKAGFAVYGVDYEGHGKSAGLQGYVENMDHVINDCSSHFTSICEKQENKGRMRYLLGESLGGAVALLLHRKKPDFWDGAVLVAPMCKIADDVRPPQMVITILRKLCSVIPTWKIIPTKDVVDAAFKLPEVRQQVRENPYCYKGKPRLNTGNELLRISLDLEQRLEEVSLPFLVLHGEEDKVTDKSVSEKLFSVASSSDKTIKLYPEMWHGLLYGEPVENRDIVFGDIIDWLGNRTHLGNTRLEMEQKRMNDAPSKSK